jgi:hypothetical protein
MLRRLALLCALLPPCTVGAQARDSALYVRDAGPGEAGRVLRAALEKPYVSLYEKWNTVLTHGRTYDSTVLVLGSDATVQGTVHGDVIVIDGSINLTSTAHIDGRALAFGGNVYDAEGAVVTGGRAAYPAAHFDTVRTARGLALDYHGPPPPERDLIALPGVYGFAVPLYDRVDGLSVAWNPQLMVGDSAFLASASVTYRSNLGLFDPLLSLGSRFGGGAFVDVTGGRATRTNDGWIQSDIANSFMVLCCGRDFRNYWRADYAEGKAGFRWADTTHAIMLWAGARTENSSSVTAGGPWSITGDEGPYSMLRPNPAIAAGRISSFLAGGSVALTRDWELHASLQAEFPWAVPGDLSFTQFVLDLDAKFPTAHNQHLLFYAHALYTNGDTAPPQRYGYLGGSGSVVTLGLLTQGGDQLVFGEVDYRYTFDGIQIPFVSSPWIELTVQSGAAGAGRLPRLTQNVGAQLEFKPFRFAAFVDPATGQTAYQILLWFVR